MLCRKSSAEIEAVLGYVAEAEMVHRDNLVVMHGL
jgi:glutamate 5-kinase